MTGQVLSSAAQSQEQTPLWGDDLKEGEIGGGDQQPG